LTSTPTKPSEHIVEELTAGNKIQAIKLHRDTMGSGLKEAKDFVEEIERMLEDDV